VYGLWVAGGPARGGGALDVFGKAQQVNGAAAGLKSTGKLSAMEEIMQGDLAKKAKFDALFSGGGGGGGGADPWGIGGGSGGGGGGGADRPWLAHGIVVKIMSKALQSEGLYKKKAVVKAVVDGRGLHSSTFHLNLSRFVSETLRPPNVSREKCSHRAEKWTSVRLCWTGASWRRWRHWTPVTACGSTRQGGSFSSTTRPTFNLLLLFLPRPYEQSHSRYKLESRAHIFTISV